jgi:hypothetical protein
MTFSDYCSSMSLRFGFLGWGRSFAIFMISLPFPELGAADCTFSQRWPIFRTQPRFRLPRYNQLQHVHDIWPPNWMRDRCIGNSLCPRNFSVSRRTRSIFGSARAGQCPSGSESRSSLEDCHRAIRLDFTPQRRDFTPRCSFFDVILESKVPADQFARIQLYPPLLILLSLPL